MPTPDWREGDVLTALLDERAGLDDPMKVAAALDDLQAGTRKAPGSLHERVHAMLQPVAAEPPRPARRLRLGRPRLLPAVGLAAAAAVLVLGVVFAAGTGSQGGGTIVDAARTPVTEAAAALDQIPRTAAPPPAVAKPKTMPSRSAPLGATQ